jgi:hypothetical protein
MAGLQRMNVSGKFTVTTAQRDAAFKALRDKQFALRLRAEFASTE